MVRVVTWPRLGGYVIRVDGERYTNWKNNRKMDKAIIKKITTRTRNFIVKNGALEYYSLGSGERYKTFNINKLITDNQYFQEVYDQGYNWYRKKFWTKSHNLKEFYIPITKNFIEFYLSNWDKEENKGNIVLSNRDLNNNVDSFYGFSLEVEIEGFRSSFNTSNAYYSTIYLNFPWKDEDLAKRMTDVLGEARTVPENEHDKYGRFSKNYIVPMSRIDKVIGIKRYRKISSFGSCEGEDFTGEEEEFILDLHNFNEDIYKVFKEHKMLEIER